MSIRLLSVRPETLKLTIDISQSIFLHPDGAITVGITVRNNRSEILKNCYVREYEFTNIRGQQSEMQRYFQLREDMYADMAKHVYRKTFDLHGQESQTVDIAYFDNTDKDSRVIMLYATEPTAPTLNAIMRDLFPHRLVVSVGADNLLAARRTYDLGINDVGILEMTPVVDRVS